MAATQDYYDILGIKKDAGADEIKKAYRKLAKKYHPDSNAGNTRAEQKFKEISEAYSILSDPEKKKLYDQFGHAAFSQTGSPKEDFYGGFGNGFNNGFGGRHAKSPNGSYTEYHFEGKDMDDFLHSFFGGEARGFRGHGSHGFYDSTGDSFYDSAGFYGSAGAGFHDSTDGGFYDRAGGGFDGFSHRSAPRKGADLTSDISVTFEEAALGCDKIIRLKNPQTGQEQSLQVHIPAGIDSGMTIRLRGKGMPGIDSKTPGDLLLSVTVLEKPGYERNGMDIHTSIRIPFPTAVFGGEALVSTLYGNVLCKIQPGTQSGTRIRLRGKGIVSMKNASIHGDQYVTVQIDVPGSLSREAAEKLKEYEQACRNSKDSKTSGHSSGGSGKTTAA